jgi:hypothetical protein
VDQNNLDAERAKDGDVEKEVGEIFRTCHLAIHGDHEDALSEEWDIL